MSLRQSLRRLYDDGAGRHIAAGGLGLFAPAMLSLGLAEFLPDAGFRMIFPIMLIVVNAILFFVIRPTEHRTERSHIVFAALGLLRLIFLLTR